MTTPDRRRRIGDLEIPVLGLGTCPLGGVYAAVDEDRARATFEAAWNAGIRLYDTAPWYGLGQAEHRTGRALHAMPRSDYVLTTKVGRVLKAPRDRAGFTPPAWQAPLQFDLDHVFTYDAIMRSYEDSLQRLGINQVDALYIHDLDSGYYPSPGDLDAKFRELEDGGYRALDELKRAGEGQGHRRRDQRAGHDRAVSGSGRSRCLSGRVTLHAARTRHLCRRDRGGRPALRVRRRWRSIQFRDPRHPVPSKGRSTNMRLPATTSSRG